MSAPVAASMSITFLDVGQGDATLVSADGHHVLIDGGQARDDAIVPLRHKGIRQLDLVVATHAHADHTGGLISVLEDKSVDTLWYNGDEHTTQTFEAFLDAALDSEARYVEPTRGRTKALGGLEVTALHPGGDTQGGHLHDRNIVVRVSEGGCSAVITGDIETDGELGILRSGMEVDADVLELGHHGSRTSTGQRWLEAVDPDYVVAQYGEGNHYGHPHGEVLDRVERVGAEMLGTGAHGTIRMRCSGGVWEARAEARGPVVAGDRGGGAAAGVRAEEPPATEAEAGCIDLNEASDEALEEIVHIGSVRAEAIIDDRPWSSVSELNAIHGLGPARVGDIKEQGEACVR